MNNLIIVLKSVSLVMLIALIAACQQIPTQNADSSSNEYARITSDTLPSLFDKKLTLDGNHLIVSADGSFSGNWNNAPMAGTWKMDNDYFCRTLTVFFKPENTGTEDCQLWEISDNKVRGTRDKGNGGSFIYEMK